MIKLLEKVLEAHGGLKRWNELKKVTVTISAGGRLLQNQGIKLNPTPREMTVYLHEQHSSVKPYGAPDQFSDFRPGRIAIETDAGEVIAERKGTVAEIQHHMTLSDTWDKLDHTYFNGYAMWNYMNTPFFMTFPGVTVEETEPWQENETEQWQVLRVTLPADLAGHSKVQLFYFDSNYLLRRLDYHIDYGGEFDIAHYVYNIVEVAGIKVPTTRRAYKKGDNNRPIMDELMIWIDESNLRYS